VNDAAPLSKWIAIGALLAAAGVALGAFGAHGLSEALAGLGYAGDDLEDRLANYETAVRYQLVHALAIVLVGVIATQRPRQLWNLAAAAFFAGVLLFSGLLYALAFAGPSWKLLGAIVPFGGLSLIVGWVLLAVAACKR
jgi:uncharacterized membrane protein YgdD (TMEM256/DUF423 family)